VDSDPCFAQFSAKVQTAGIEANLSKFLAELKRRHVYRAAVAYAMVAWLLTQVATQVFPFFDIPNSAVRFVIVVLLFGFPIAMLLAWLYEFTGEGFVREENVDPEARKSARRLWDFVIIGILLLLVAALIYGRLPSRSSSGEVIPEKSIAVLPFTNMSADPENAFFADGIQDDILTSLSKIKDLRVISRTSVMGFRGGRETHNLREIGRTPGVTNILESSVRREGNRVAVTVQLLDATKDRHLWANRYDRTLADSLGLQGKLAAQIADELRVKLTADEKARVDVKPTENPDAYVVYLQANQSS
jgi:TolB-like protein